MKTFYVTAQIVRTYQRTFLSSVANIFQSRITHIPVFFTF